MVIGEGSVQPCLWFRHYLPSWSEYLFCYAQTQDKSRRSAEFLKRFWHRNWKSPQYDLQRVTLLRTTTGLSSNRKEIFLFINFPPELADKISCHLHWSASLLYLAGVGAATLQGHHDQHKSLALSVSSRGIFILQMAKCHEVPEYCNDIWGGIFHCLCGF